MKDLSDNLFDWKEEGQDELLETKEKKQSFKQKKTKKNALKPLQLRQAVLIWIAKQNPSGIGINVPTRFIKFKADVAAFWSYPLKKKIYAPYKVVLIEIRSDREECWPDFSKNKNLLQDLIELKNLKRQLEEKIKIDEPNLKDNDLLFNEYGSWRFKESKNKNYQRCLKNIEKIEHSIYKGSSFERIRRAHMADNLYIAVPKDLIHPDELADGWGLLYINNDLSVKTIKEPEDKDCSDENRMHMTQTISASAAKVVLFSQGINISQDGKFFITTPPRRRLITQDRMIF